MKNKRNTKRNTQKTPEVVVQNITIKQTRRNSQDIASWRNAIKAFEKIDNPSRVKLYELYEDILLDGHMEAVWGKRQDAITNKELVFVHDGKEDEEINKVLNSPDMRNLLKDLHDTILWGYSLIQVNSIDYNEDEERYIIDYDLINRKHVHPEDGFQCVSKEQNQATRDILYQEPPLSKYMIWAGKPKDMGLGVKVAQYVIYKRGDFGDWAQFAELFGMPFREARYDGFDDATRIALEKAMENYGGASYAVLPKDADFELHDAVKGSAGNLYKLLMDACNAEISKCILGNTLTTEQGTNGARSLGEVHQSVEEQKYASDLKFVEDIINTKFKAILKVFGFNVSGGNITFKSSGVDWNKMKVKWDVLNSMSNKIPLSDDYIYEEMEVPKPDNYDEIKKKMETDKTADLSLKIPQVGELTEPKTLIQKIKDFFV